MTEEQALKDLVQTTGKLLDGVSNFVDRSWSDDWKPIRTDRKVEEARDSADKLYDDLTAIMEKWEEAVTT